MRNALEQTITKEGGRDALANKLGVHPNTIRYWESGLITVKRARQLSELTGIPWQDFIPPSPSNS